MEAASGDIKFRFDVAKRRNPFSLLDSDACILHTNNTMRFYSK